jgi:hypothetical protein
MEKLKGFAAALLGVAIVIVTFSWIALYILGAVAVVTFPIWGVILLCVYGC